ncbi:hypothetical protein HMPREF0005_00678 [Achromobacter xylosoxidans C54]|uniref:DUF4917 family protein n=1 Tax=Alcaligenes xylosoxydans xylosoxydans TaxID=85698 RepID=UPI0001F42425|nr:DUF4917 family protein [Achromobacter xylosoxidans]EFV82363.1 hypothetical protein HMPREF0005_00678 [Achromobacter xylosoxidans C54]
MHYEKFEHVMAELKKKKRKSHLLLGNGFSMAYDNSIFSYNALFNFVASLKDRDLAAILGVMKTKNFELMMEQLEAFSSLLKVFGGDEALQAKVHAAHDGLRKSLIDAIRSMHPEHVFKVSDEKSAACAHFVSRFLETGGSIFTSNYDLLLYWVLMRQNIPNACDGFGRDLLNPLEVERKNEDPEWSTLRWGPNKAKQNIFYVHGALPLFDTGTEVEKEQYGEGGYLLENISSRIELNNYPVFVTAGNGDDKLAQIRANPYLAHCYDSLCAVDGSIVSFGFGFGDSDLHIVDALNRATHIRSNTIPKLWSVYIGVFNDADKARAESLQQRLHAKVHTYDAATAHLWG